MDGSSFADLGTSRSSLGPATALLQRGTGDGAHVVLSKSLDSSQGGCLVWVLCHGSCAVRTWRF